MKAKICLAVLAATLWGSSALAGNWNVNYSIGVMGTPALTVKSRTNCDSVTIPDNTCDTTAVHGLGLEYRYKRIGVAVDVTWNSFGSGHQPFLITNNDPTWGTLSMSRLSGNVFGFALLAKYYQPVTEKISLFVGVGPGLAYSVIEGSDLNLGHAQAVMPMLVVEGGMRVFILPNLTGDLFFRYRYSYPSYEFNAGVDGAPLYMAFAYNNFEPGVRLAYHF